MKECWCGNKNLNNYTKQYARCNECHTLISRHPFQNDIYEVDNDEDGLYGKNYWDIDMIRAAGKNTLSEVLDMYLTERVVYWMKYIFRYVTPGGSVAEVGCGLGQLAYALKCAGFEQIAYELSPGICNYIRNELKIQVRCGSFEEKKDAYDAVLAFDLFEHLLEPLAFLKQCSNSLKEHGVLCMQTPCYDSNLYYEEMMTQCPRFEEQLKEEQHVYLYSKTAIERILQSAGFRHIVFVPAFFGDDYDMFLFASKQSIQMNKEQETDDYLNRVSNGRLIKAMIRLFDEKQEYLQKVRIEQENSVERLKQNERLTELLKESEADRAARLGQVQHLTELLTESEADRAARLEQVQHLTELLKESEADRAARLEQIHQLSSMLEESEADRAARFEQIQHLTELLKKKR